jgi:RNA polymerase sigma factor (sigma-70 family)
MQNMNTTSDETDTRLVEKAREGDRTAFSVLVVRHQSAVCAIAYSICGDFQISEDIAQEVFISAWRQLAELHDTERFRAWSCGMARYRATDHLRRTGRRGGRPQENNETQTDPSATPDEGMMSAEESELVWKAVQGLDATYREPLVLFYREQQSVLAVATALEISPEAARQRLSRARSLLREELARRVETAFARTRPGMAFTAGVMGALPPLGVGAGLLLVPAGNAAASSATGVLSGGSATGGSAVAGAVGSTVVGLAGLFVLFRAMRSPNLSPEIRRIVQRCTFLLTGVTVLFTAWVTWFAATRGAALSVIGIPPAISLVISIFLFIGIVAVVSIAAAVKAHRLGTNRPAAQVSSARRYCSSARLFGLPLVCVALGPDAERRESRGVAKGWVALGDVAVGPVAVGGVSVGVIALGGITVGVLPVGLLAFGFLAIGCTAVGVEAVGALAIGLHMAVGGCAIGYGTAIGGMAIAVKGAWGGYALAIHPGEGVSAESFWVSRVLHLLPYAGWLSFLGVPGILYAVYEIRRGRL